MVISLTVDCKRSDIDRGRFKFLYISKGNIVLN